MKIKVDPGFSRRNLPLMHTHKRIKSDILEREESLMIEDIHDNSTIDYR